MTTTIIAFLGGMALMSILSFIAVLLADTSHYYITALCTGPVMWLYLAIGVPIVRITNAVRLSNFKRNYVRVALYHADAERGKDVFVDTWYIHRAVIGQFYRKGENHDHAYIKIDGDCSNAKSIPSRFEKTIDKKGFKFLGDARDNYTRNLALDRIRPYTYLYNKISYRG